MTDVKAPRSRTTTLSLYLTIGTLLAAAVLGGFFIIVGDQAAIAARAWLTLLLVVLFAGSVLLDASVSNGPNRWYLPASTITNVVLVAVGLLKLWNGWLQPADTADPWVWTEQMFRFVLVVLLLRLALLVTQLYGLHFVTRAKSQATRISSIVTLVLVWCTALIIAIPAAFPAPEWPDWWWRIAAATTLAAVVATVIPLIVRAFEPKEPGTAASQAAAPARAAAPPSGVPQQAAAAAPQLPPPYVPPVAAPETGTSSGQDEGMVPPR